MRRTEHREGRAEYASIDQKLLALRERGGGSKRGGCSGPGGVCVSVRNHPLSRTHVYLPGRSDARSARVDRERTSKREVVPALGVPDRVTCRERQALGWLRRSEDLLRLHVATAGALPHRVDSTGRGTSQPCAESSSWPTGASPPRISAARASSTTTRRACNARA